MADHKLLVVHSHGLSNELQNDFSRVQTTRQLSIEVHFFDVYKARIFFGNFMRT